MDVVGLSDWTHSSIHELEVGDLFAAKMSDIDVLVLLGEESQERFGLILSLAANDPFDTSTLPSVRSISTLQGRVLRFTGKVGARPILEGAGEQGSAFPRVHDQAQHGSLVIDNTQTPWVIVHERRTYPRSFAVSLKSGETALTISGAIFTAWDLVVLQDTKIRHTLTTFGKPSA